MPLVLYDTPWKHQKNYDSRGTEKRQWDEWVNVVIKSEV